MMRRVFAAVFLCLAFVTAAFIFCRSAQNGTASTGESDRVTQAVAPVVVPSYPVQTKTQKQETVGRLGEKVRSFAHALEFSALGFCLSAALWLWPCYPLCRPLVFLASFPASVLYALTDEIHQLFVPGRAFEWKDVGLDALGAAVGCLLCVALFALAGTVGRLRSGSGKDRRRGKEN